MPNNITYRKLKVEDLNDDFLARFKRYQVTNKVLANRENSLYEKEDYFIDDWDNAKKVNIAREMRNCVLTGGAVIGAFREEELVGFANINNNHFGKTLDYVELPYIHVSKNYRGYNVGKSLFYLCCESAKKLGARKLYIGAHPSIETQSFYKAMGCTLAKEINEEIYNREPLDIQLEYVL
ncbi:GNAT family N-acetyltransferase [Lottiidibacillus patelloidae]|uniref:GNAT family N-acetyltransferase n=1 Tax=Lottiidibacillus patelloidae TaxID=2670334 RepID=UPI00115509ED|nr:GNAT family N-acetyltransferase [Lottiidibacillus patelloidae]